MADLDISKPPNVFHVDVNGDGAFTISDVLHFLGNAFFVPGDWLIWTTATYAPSLAGFLELGPSAYGGILSGFVSAFAWLASLLLLIIVWGSIRELDRALTSLIVRGYAEARRRIRVTVALLGYRLRSLHPRSPKPAGVEVSEGIELNAVELAVLQLYTNVQSGYALSESEVAERLELRRHRAEEALGRLRKLGMLEATLGGSEGESAYRLTGAGRGLLVHRQLSRASPAERAQGKSSKSTTEAVSAVGPFKKRML